MTLNYLELPFRNTYIYEGSPTINFQGVDLKLGFNLLDEYRLLLTWDFPEIIAGSEVYDDAYLRLYCHTPADTGSFEIWRLTENTWVEDEATWNNYKTGSGWPGGAGAAGDADDTDEVEGSLPTGDPQWHNILIQDLIQDAITNRAGWCNLSLKFIRNDFCSTVIKFLI